MRIFSSGLRALLGGVLVTLAAACGASRPSTVNSRPAAEAVDSALGVATFDTAWQRIADTHFDTTYGGVDWNAVRTELRPRAAAARNDEQLRTVLRAMIGRLGESHFGLIPREASPPATNGEPGVTGEGEPRFHVRLVDDEIVITQVDTAGSAHAAGVRPGWVLLRIGAIDVDAMVRRLREAQTDLPPRMERMHAWSLVTHRLTGPIGSYVELTMRDGRDSTVHVVVRREAPRGEVVRLMQLPPLAAHLEHERRTTAEQLQIGVIRFNIWLTPIAPSFARAVDELRDADGIVLDLRGNLGGLGAMAMGISGHFLDTTVSLGTMRTRDTELRFVSSPQRVSAAGQRVRPYDGPLVILVDELSVSTSEIFAGGMQAIGRARVVGDTTTGQALPARAVRLPNGDVLLHAFADFRDPTGERIEGRGVIPDVQVSLERVDLLHGRDPMLEAAMQVIVRMRATGGSAGAERVPLP